MAFKPNYNQQRADRNRAKEQKKQEKLRQKEEAVAQRKASHGPETSDDDPAGEGQADVAQGETAPNRTS
ncbi:hypothetical protein IGS68_02635 [Skermanella sp. TT6]|uniref:DUF4169 domain-containing protein n=1 Tax=Skermanella cutis TaxID=2775420 RepID=A0ABX7BAU7_9PROT|nr:hypothetical protein [Skermanella sp. TT6]QQP90181.1 hypothetical protein IGS68_02635 [Skermanella sp. TT6]